MGQDYSPEELEQALDWAVKCIKFCGGCINQCYCYKSTLEEIIDEYCASKRRVQWELQQDGKVEVQTLEGEKAILTNEEFEKLCEGDALN